MRATRAFVGSKSTQKELNYQVSLHYPHNALSGKISNHSSVIYKNKMYLFGGCSGLQNNETFFGFDPQSNMWEVVRTKPHQDLDMHTAPVCD
jgi:N-acetylneuraminic acid mutarotase